MLTDDDVEVAILLATHLSSALSAMMHTDQARDQIRNLRLAVDSRDLIGRAKGILMQRHGLSNSAAFDALSAASQRLNVKLRDLAEHLIRTGELPSPSADTSRPASPDRSPIAPRHRESAAPLLPPAPPFRTANP